MNRFGVLFCEACRSRLNLAAEHPGLKTAPPARRRIAAWLPLGVLFLITGLGVLVFWPMGNGFVPGSPAALQAFRQKLWTLRHAAVPVRQNFAEVEINAGLAAALARFPSPASPWQLDLKAAGVSVKPKGVIVSYLAQLGPFPARHYLLGPFKISVRLIYAYAAPGKFSLRRAWLGHVCLPGPLARLAVWPARPFWLAVKEQLAPGRVLSWEVEDGGLAAQVTSISNSD